MQNVTFLYKTALSKAFVIANKMGSPKFQNGPITTSGVATNYPNVNFRIFVKSSVVGVFSLLVP